MSLPILTDLLDLDDLAAVIVSPYLRVSLDASGVLRSNVEQLGDLQAIIDRRRTWCLGPVYSDEGSASPFRQRERRGFADLTADLRAGTFAAHVLALWEASRGSRDVPEWYEFLALCQQRRVFIFVTSLRRLFDPMIAMDWFDLMSMGLKAEFESRQSSERIKRSTKADADDGRYHGGRRPFGYKSDGLTIEPAERDRIREAVDRVLAGESPRAIAKSWNEQGVLTSSGNAWHPNVLRNLLIGTRIIGKRTHHKKIMDKCDWPAIIDESTQKRVKAVLRNRSQIGRRGKTPWLLTGFLVCEKCGSHLVSWSDNAPKRRDPDAERIRRYTCRKAPGYRGCGGVTIKAEPLEDLLGDLVTWRLRDVEARKNAVPSPDMEIELAELDSLNVLRDEADEDRWSKKIDRAEYDRRIASFDRRRDEIEARLASKSHVVAALDLVVTEAADGRAWDALDLNEKRSRLRALIVSVRVAPATTPGSPRFEPERVTEPADRITWRI